MLLDRWFRTIRRFFRSMDYIPESPFDRMKPLRDDLELRLSTFDKWPSNAVRPLDLAQDYFYYIGMDDKCQCTQCGGVLGGWKEGDVVHYEHHRHFPDCPFVQDCSHGPKYPQYAEETVRLESFEDWPVQLKQTPIELVKAGLFYVKRGDRVKCFYCGGLLWNWESDDVPLIEHAKWFPDCGFIVNQSE